MDPDAIIGNDNAGANAYTQYQCKKPKPALLSRRRLARFSLDESKNTLQLSMHALGFLQKHSTERMLTHRPVGDVARPTKQPFCPSTHGAFPEHHNRALEPTAAGPDQANVPAVDSKLRNDIAAHQKQTPGTSSDYHNSSTVQTISSAEEPPTRLITEGQLINEVKGIYAGLVMVEKKCVDIINQQTESQNSLTDQQWKAVVALHRTLLQEHHDFFSATQHPTASDNLKKLAVKYAMPARMWRHGIHAFLELLRHRLPDSMEHVLSFIYLAYSMMALLDESVSSLAETWIECFEDLARYRMSIEGSDHKDRKVWSNVANLWYNHAADQISNVGRVRHHLAVLARPNTTQQLFSYGKGLVNIQPLTRFYELSTPLSDIHKCDVYRRAASSTSGISRWLIKSSKSIEGIGRTFLTGSSFLCLTTHVHARATDVGPSKGLVPQPLPNARSDDFGWQAFLWILLVFLGTLTALLGPRLATRNAISVSSILAFMSALAMCTTKNENFPNVWGVVCAGVSIGASAWLGKITRAKDDSILVFFLRYMVPTAIFWQVLCLSEFSDQKSPLDLSVSIPCLSVFGSVGLNALLNEKAREFKNYLHRQWERVLHHLELEPVRRNVLHNPV